MQIKELQEILRQGKMRCSLKKEAPSNTMRGGEYKRASYPLDFSSFHHLLELNAAEKYVIVEPRMTVRELSSATLPYGLIPPVVPEFASITVGGAIMGAALESSSHRYGQFNDAALEYELLLGDGTLITASPEENPDLFYGISGSYGTLALLTKVKLRLIPAKSHVHLHYHKFENQDDLLACLRHSQADYIEGILLSPHWGVAIEGYLADRDNTLPEYRQNHSWHKWYYQNICEKTKEGDAIEQMPINEYLFRLDRGAFWMGRLLLNFPLMLRLLSQYRLSGLGKRLRSSAASLAPDSNPSLLFRLLFGRTLSSERLYHLWHAVPQKISQNLLFVQDFYAPLPASNEILSHFRELTGMYPIWLCPIKGTQTPQFLSPHFGKPAFLNIGLYGIPQVEKSIPALTEELERAIVSFGGRKMLYALTYYSEEDFSKIYEYERYKELRSRFHAEKSFLPLYNKIANMV